MIYFIYNRKKFTQEGEKMAKYDVTFSCGHTETIQLYGKDSDKKRRIEWLEKYGTCSECYKNFLDEQAEECKKKCNDIGLFIEGSEKQIRWAYRIAATSIYKNIELIKKAEAVITEHSDPKLEEAARAYLEMRKKIENIATTKIDAKFWINHQEDAYDCLKKELEQGGTNET